MKALVIPANSSEPVKEIEFYQDESWRYVITRDNWCCSLGREKILEPERLSSAVRLTNSCRVEQEVV
jgi:hypothetical protein